MFSYIVSKRPANLFCGSYFFSYLCVVDEKKLYSEIEKAIINWSNNGNQTAGTLTRDIIEIISKHNQPINDVDFMYKWITKHSGRESK